MFQLRAFNDTITGDTATANNKRRAFHNALAAAIPDVGTGEGQISLRGSLRQCLRILAPDYIWQYFAAKSGKGSKKNFYFRSDLPTTYNIVLL